VVTNDFDCISRIEVAFDIGLGEPHAFIHARLQAAAYSLTDEQFLVWKIKEQACWPLVFRTTIRIDDGELQLLQFSVAINTLGDLVCRARSVPPRL
jgi:hypothetical protein